MNGILSDDTKAITLLCSPILKDNRYSPLTLREYNRLVMWLLERKMRPENLFEYDFADPEIGVSGIEPLRLETLIKREVQLALAIEKWEQSGIWIKSRSDQDYPVRLKAHLKEKAPPLIFGIGDDSLLAGGGLAIVGSRKVDTAGQKFTNEIASLCALNNMPVVSGGAKGVDVTAMKSSLDNGGVVIGVLADNLLKKSLESAVRYAVHDGRMLLISPYHPKAHFTVGTAMGRNKLIYAMADYALVVSSDYNKGGTWNGATEELKRDNSIPVFVRTGEDVPEGNKKLLDSGALTWPELTDRENLREELINYYKLNKKESSGKDNALLTHASQLNLFEE